MSWGIMVVWIPIGWRLDGLGMFYRCLLDVIQAIPIHIPYLNFYERKNAIGIKKHISAFVGVHEAV
ncbi:hypothetical protein J42TS3_35260 [Paenibacillus vini]|uniref:Uncharacterized protein n=1 Tax=Paenibacillus vini TaxID=1476024 RepID=A0ABQ4MET5_9BACL|nr:hypothetical protein J42TS3_35260 [Paenibacillus vini]